MGTSLKSFKKNVSKIKLDFGCGPNPRDGFIGVDKIQFPKVDILLNIGVDKWPWKNESVEEAHASHFIEHLTAEERIHFVNELYRVLVPGGKCQIIVPHFASCRAYGDLTHKWPPVTEFWFYYLNSEWRKSNAPHNDMYSCNFEATWGYTMNQDLVNRNQEFQQFAIQYYKEAAQDLVATLIKR